VKLLVTDYVCWQYHSAVKSTPNVLACKNLQTPRGNATFWPMTAIQIEHRRWTTRWRWCLAGKEEKNATNRPSSCHRLIDAWDRLLSPLQSAGKRASRTNRAHAGCETKTSDRPSRSLRFCDRAPVSHDGCSRWRAVNKDPGAIRRGLRPNDRSQQGPFRLA